MEHSESSDSLNIPQKTMETQEKVVFPTKELPAAPSIKMDPIEEPKSPTLVKKKLIDEDNTECGSHSVPVSRKKKSSGFTFKKLKQNFSGSKTKKAETHVATDEEKKKYKDEMISLQELSLLLISIQDDNNMRREELHEKMVQLNLQDKNDKKGKGNIKKECEVLREIIAKNELLMANYEHTIETIRTGKQNEVILFELTAAFERVLAQADTDVKASSHPPTIVHSINDLPDNITKEVLKSGISRAQMEKYFSELLNVISFTLKSKYMTECQVQRWKETKIADSIAPNYGRITKPLEHFLTDPNLRQSPKKLYKLINKEGKGGFGQVFFAKNRKTGKQVAIKKQQIDTRSKRRQCANEASFLYFVNHQNLVQFENVFKDGDDVWIIMEYLDGGSISTALSMRPLTESHIAYMADQLLLGLKYLHSNNIVHRDIKGDNIMLTELAEIVIVDLGMCLDTEEFNPAIHRGGTSVFMAPEVINGKKEVTTAADIWSFGICLLEMANSCVPYGDNHTLGMFKVASGTLESVDELLLEPAKWSADFKDLVAQCLKFDPAARSTAEFLLGHKFFYSALHENSRLEVMHVVRFCWQAQTALQGF